MTLRKYPCFIPRELAWRIIQNRQQEIVTYFCYNIPMDILSRKTIREILELSANPTVDEVRANYKRLVKQYHPDINKTPEAEEYMKRLNVAYEIATGKRSLDQVQQPPPPPRREVIIINMNFGGFGGGFYRSSASYSYSGTSDGTNWF